MPRPTTAWRWRGGRRRRGGRSVDIVANARNSGSVFAQWRRGLERARGEWVWIAEADDEAEPELLARLAARVDAAPGIVAVACDSRAIDVQGAVLW